MRSLIFLSTILILLLSINSYSQTVTKGSTPVCDIYPHTPHRTSEVWQKYIGQNNPAHIPEIIDFSYAGYHQGSDIPERFPHLNTFAVKNYGAIPNDNLDDKDAIQRAINAASVKGGLVFFSPGQYDVFNGVLGIGGSNVIIKGCGAAGAEKGGTTIKAHSGASCFMTAWQGSRGEIAISGVIPQRSKYITVDSNANIGFLNGGDFLVISRDNIKDNDWSKFSSRPRYEMLNEWNIKEDGINIIEYHEIESIVGNRINLKTDTTVEFNSNYSVARVNFNTDVGIEDLHIDHSFDEVYRHLVQWSAPSIKLRNCANSFVRRVRISNCITAIDVLKSYCSSVVGIIVDGRAGHYSCAIKLSSFCFLGLLEDHTDIGIWHGVSVCDNAAANVIWYVGGPKMRGPDCHGSQPRLTLHDNYYSRYHESHGGAIFNLPNHLDKYIRWNNHISDHTNSFNVWNPGGYSFTVTDAILVGYNQNSRNRPINAYVESFNQRIKPISLYEEQMNRRVGYFPLWLSKVKQDHRDMLKEITDWDIYPIKNRTIQVQTAILKHYRHLPRIRDINDVDLINPHSLKEIHTIELSNNRIPELKNRDLSNLTGLKNISLVGNELTSLPAGLLSDCPLVHRIELDDNNLTSLPDGFLVGKKRLAMLTMEGNDEDPINIKTYVQEPRSMHISAHIPTGSPHNAKIHISIINGIPTDIGTFSIVHLGGGKYQCIKSVTVKTGETQSTPFRIKPSPNPVGDNIEISVYSTNNNLIPEYTHTGYKLINGMRSPMLIPLNESGNAPQLSESIPDKTDLLTNFPNPFNPETWIPYQLANDSEINITFYDSHGIIVRYIPLGIKPAGYYTDKSRAAHWDGRNAFGEPVSAGIYFYQLNTRTLSILKKMVIIK